MAKAHPEPSPSTLPPLTFHPLTPERWDDFEELFGPRGACAGCWCMWWRLRRSEFERQKGDGNKAAMKEIVRSGEIPGLLAYADGRPIAWCSVAPRKAFPALERSRVLERVDEKPVWSVVCLFVARPFRRRGLTTRLLEAAVRHVRKHGGKILEGYPVEPREGKMPDAFAWTGLASAFRRAGFEECARRSPTRPIMRRTVAGRGR